MLTDMLEQMNTLMDAVLEGDTLDKMADIYEAMRDKLIARGFTPEEAANILAHQGAFKAG